MKPQKIHLGHFLFVMSLALVLCRAAVPAAPAAPSAPASTDTPPPSQPHRAAWLRQAHWGVMTHYLADWRARADRLQMSPELWNDLIDHFDVEGFANQLHSVGAGYLIFTIGQNSGYYCSPNAAYDKIVGHQPGHCSRRDLIADLAAALGRRGIRLIAYLPAGAPAGDRAAAAALQWQNGPHRNAGFQRMWEQVIREWSLRWGSKVSGWWFDGCYWPNTMYRGAPPNFATFAAAARAGNPSAIVAFNPGVYERIHSIAPEEDYTAGETNAPDRVQLKRAADGLTDGAQIQVLSFLGEKWGMGAPRFTPDQVVQWSRKVNQAGGAITWDTPLQKNGLISEAFLTQLRALGQAQ